MGFYYDHNYPRKTNAATRAHAKFLQLHPQAGNQLFHTDDANEQRDIFAFAYEITNVDLDSIIRGSKWGRIGEFTEFLYDGHKYLHLTHRLIRQVDLHEINSMLEFLPTTPHLMLRSNTRILRDMLKSQYQELGKEVGKALILLNATCKNITMDLPSRGEISLLRTSRPTHLFDDTFPFFLTAQMLPCMTRQTDPAEYLCRFVHTNTTLFVTVEVRIEHDNTTQDTFNELLFIVEDRNEKYVLHRGPHIEGPQYKSEDWLEDEEEQVPN